jgi:hypothetical protein
MRLTRRALIQGVLANTAGLVGRAAFADVKKNFSPLYANVSHSKPQWKMISKGVEFSKIEVRRNKELVDVLAVLRIDPRSNRIRVFSSYEQDKTIARTIEDWQKHTGAIAMTNSAQYMADPYYMPCAPIICDGKLKGPKSNASVRGMLVAEPVKGTCRKQICSILIMTAIPQELIHRECNTGRFFWIATARSK